MREFIRRLFRPKYKTLNIIEINAKQLLANYNYLRSLQSAAAMFPVLKSNAYGHGLKEVCQILNSTDAVMVAVDSYPEAQVAYHNFKGKVLILGEMPLKIYDYCLLKRTEFVVYNEETLRYLTRFGKQVQIHLFVNSGMNREGIQDLPAWLIRNKKYLDKVQVSGLCSHLASADQDSALNVQQENNFAGALNDLRIAGFFPRWIHLGNSAAIFTLHNELLTAYRPGLAFYGYNPFSGQANRREQEEKAARLKPALEVYSQIISLQEAKAGESVSYNENYHVREATTIGVIPFGYFEGLDRRLSNQAKFLVISAKQNFWSPVAGKICMNLTCLDIGRRLVKIGDRVQIVSANSVDPNSIANLAGLSAMVIYELLVKFQANIRRKIIK